jgi:hypothetical protein
MPLTHRDLMYKLSQLDEITLLELLDIKAEDLVERFQDCIEEKRDQFEADLEDTNDYE